MSFELWSKFPFKAFVGYKLRNLITDNPSSAPEKYKHWLLEYYARRFQIRTFIETGTLMGDTVNALIACFNHIHTIELDKRFYAHAVVRFKQHNHVTCHLGDSEFKLTELVAQQTQACLFWLDAHAMVGGVVGNQTTPVLEELNSIFNHSRGDHIILIDDARMFDRGSYPSMKNVTLLVKKHLPKAKVTVKNDVIRILNRS